MPAFLRHRHGTAADLARLLACWLVAIVLVQGLAATLTQVRGPAHRHLSMTALGAAHALAHASGAPHHHAAADLALPADSEAALDAAALLLLGVLAWCAVGFVWVPLRAHRMPHAGPSWAALTHVADPPRRPPRG